MLSVVDHPILIHNCLTFSLLARCLTRINAILLDFNLWWVHRSRFWDPARNQKAESDRHLKNDHLPDDLLFQEEAGQVLSYDDASLLAHEGRHWVQERHTADEQDEAHGEDDTAQNQDDPRILWHIEEVKLLVPEVEDHGESLHSHDAERDFIGIDRLTYRKQLVDGNQDWHLDNPCNKTGVKILRSCLSVKVDLHESHRT